MHHVPHAAMQAVVDQLEEDLAIVLGFASHGTAAESRSIERAAAEIRTAIEALRFVQPE